MPRAPTLLDAVSAAPPSCLAPASLLLGSHLELGRRQRASWPLLPRGLRRVRWPLHSRTHPRGQSCNLEQKRPATATPATRAIPSAFVRTWWSGRGLPGQGGAPHRLNDLDRAGPAHSALPGRRLSGWRHHPRAPERPAGGTVYVSTNVKPRSCHCSWRPGASSCVAPPAGYHRSRRGRRPKARAAGPSARPRFGGASGPRSGPP